MNKYPQVPPALDQLFPSNPVFFVTACTYRRLALLANDTVHNAFVGFSQRAYEGTESLSADTLSCQIIFIFLSAVRTISN